MIQYKDPNSYSLNKMLLTKCGCVPNVWYPYGYMQLMAAHSHSKRKKDWKIESFVVEEFGPLQCLCKYQEHYNSTTRQSKTRKLDYNSLCKESC